MTQSTLPNNVYRFFKYEFDDESVFDIRKEYGEALWLDFPPNDANVKTVGVKFTHEHKGDSLLPVIGLTYTGDRHLFTKERAINVATVRLLGWIDDAGCETTFNKVELRTIYPDCIDDMHLKDVTIESRVAEAEYNIALQLLRATEPSDF